MLIFSTTDYRNDDAFELWRTAICEQFVPLRPEPARSATDFFGELRSWPIGRLTLTDIRLSGQHIHRDVLEIAHSNRETFFLTVQLAGESGFVCGDHAQHTRPGDMYFLDGRRPFELCHDTPAHQLSLSIPRQTYPQWLTAFDYSHGLAITSGNTVGDLLRDYLRGVASADNDLGAAEQEDIADHVLALISHVLARCEPNAAPSRTVVREALFTKARRLIERRLCDPDFDPANLAREVHVSLRHLQDLFAEHDTSPMRLIYERRTALAMKLLRNPAHAGKTITEIAFECGFLDLSHFGRVFAATTGVTPRAWRRGTGIGISDFQ